MKRMSGRETVGLYCEDIGSKIVGDVTVTAMEAFLKNLTNSFPQVDQFL